MRVLYRSLWFFQELHPCACSLGGWKAVHVNRKRFGVESNLIAGSKNKKVPATIARCGCVLRRRLRGQPLGFHRRVAHQRRDFFRTGNRVLARKLTVECSHMGTSLRALSSGSLCRMSKERAEDGQASRFRCSAW